MSVVAPVAALISTALPVGVAVAMGERATAAVYAGVRPRRIIIISMCLSGAIAGCVGLNEIMGVHHRLLLNFTAGYGFTGIAVALMGRNHPAGIMLASLLFGILSQGGTELAFPSQVQGLLSFEPRRKRSPAEEYAETQHRRAENQQHRTPTATRHHQATRSGSLIETMHVQARHRVLIVGAMNYPVFRNFRFFARAWHSRTMGFTRRD